MRCGLRHSSSCISHRSSAPKLVRTCRAAARHQHVGRQALLAEEPGARSAPPIIFGEYAQYNDYFAAGGNAPCGTDFGDLRNICTAGNLPGVRTGSEMQRWGLGVVQEIDSAAMHVWARWQHQELDASYTDCTTVIGVCFDKDEVRQAQGERRRLGSVPGWRHHLLLSQPPELTLWKPPFGAASFLDRGHARRRPGESRGPGATSAVRVGLDSELPPELTATMLVASNQVPSPRRRAIRAVSIWRGLGYDGGSTV